MVGKAMFREFPAILLLLFIASLAGAAPRYVWRQVNLQGMGFVTGIIAHPAEADLIYARTDVGGIYRWNSSDDSWVPLNDSKGTGYSIESFALDPSAPNMLYAAIGHGETGHVWKSADRGGRWSKTALSVKMQGNGPWRYCGERLAVDPRNGSTLYYGSLESGLWKSTNGGGSWNRINTGLLPAGSDGGQVFVVCDPKGGGNQSGCSRIYVGVQGRGVYRTNNGGGSWQLVSNGPATAYKPIRAAITSSGRLFVTFAQKHDGGPGAVYACTGNAGFTEITPPDTSSCSFVGIDALGSNVITLKWNPGPASPMYHSTDGGSNWSSLFLNNGTQYHVGPMNVIEPGYYPTWSSSSNAGQIMFDPHHAERVWFTNGFGVYRSDNLSDRRPVWRAVMNNLEELVATVVKKPPVGKSSNVFLGCMDMVGFAISDLTVVPRTKLEPNGMGIMTGMDYCEKYPHFSVVIGSGQHQWWEDHCGVTHDNGSTWEPIPTIPKNHHNGTVAISAADTNRWVWAPENDFWDPVYLPKYTIDGGKSWHNCSGIPAKFNGTSHMWAANQFVCADRVNPNLFYYFTHYDGSRWAGFLYRSTDGGAHFSKVSDDLEAGGAVKIEAVPGVEGHLFAAHRDGDALYFSNNRGSSFSKIGGFSTCDAFAFGAPLGGSSRPTIYAGGIRNGRRSVYRSVDYGATWEDIRTNALPLDKVAVIEGDRDRPGRVYIGTSGRGFFCGDEAARVAALPRTRAATSCVRPAPDNGRWDLLGRKIGAIAPKVPYSGIVVRRTGLMPMNIR